MNDDDHLAAVYYCTCEGEERNAHGGCRSCIEDCSCPDCPEGMGETLDDLCCYCHE